MPARQTFRRLCRSERADEQESLRIGQVTFMFTNLRAPPQSTSGLATSTPMLRVREHLALLTRVVGL